MPYADTMTDHALFPLPQLAVLAIDGPDAATFLQGQATCDTRLLAGGRGLLGALCNLQGRMIVSFYVLPTDSGLALLMPRDRVAAVKAHLQKYALFSKVTLVDAGTPTVVGAASGAGETWQLVHRDGAVLLALRDGRQVGISTASPAADDDAARRWRAAAIAAGELLVDSANADRHLPQALNYDVIDGVSFRKGCYTGQEVVARMHFKGRMKERLYVARADTAAAAGSAVLDGDGRTVGSVVDAMAQDDGAVLAAVLRHDAVRQGGLRLPDGSALAPCEPQPVAFDRGD